MDSHDQTARAGAGTAIGVRDVAVERGGLTGFKDARTWSSGGPRIRADTEMPRVSASRTRVAELGLPWAFSSPTSAGFLGGAPQPTFTTRWGRGGR